MEVNKALRALFDHVEVDWQDQRLIFHWKADPEVTSDLPLFFSERVIKSHQRLLRSAGALAEQCAQP